MDHLADEQTKLVIFARHVSFVIWLNQAVLISLQTVFAERKNVTTPNKVCCHISGSYFAQQSSESLRVLAGTSHEPRARTRPGLNSTGCCLSLLRGNKARTLSDLAVPSHWGR